MNHSTSVVQLLLGIFLIVTGASCPIELQPPSVVVRYGDPVSIMCTTNENMTDGIGWEAPEGGTSLENVNNITWAVKSLEIWKISPKCYFSSDGTQCKKEPKVVLYTFPQKISMRSNNRVITEKEEHDFICDVHNVAPVQNLTVRWYKGDQLIFTETFDNSQRQPVNQSSVYRFTPTRNDTGDTIRCEAHLDLAPEGPQLNVSSQEHNLNVEFGPELKCSSVIMEGETLEKLCSVQGNPTPHVQWSKDGKNISSTFPLSRNESGTYTVNADSTSSIVKNLTVLVWYAPALHCPSNYTALENTPLNISCTVQGFPEPKLIWYKDDEEVDFKENLTRRDSGQYRIIASNEVTEVNITVEITVIYPPSPIVELEDSEVDIGATVTLKCSSVGYPKPEYSWSYSHATNIDQKNEDGVSLLHIHKADAHNMGFYTCQAWNLMGNNSKTVKVTVRGVDASCPITLQPPSVVVRYGDPVSIACMTHNSMKEGISWESSEEDRALEDTNHLIWAVKSLQNWNSAPKCNFTPLPTSYFKQCVKEPKVVLYMFPQNISMRSNNSVITEKEEHDFICDVHNVAPVQNLTVRWYKGDQLIFTETFDNSQKQPVNQSSVYRFTPTRNDTGDTIRCEAHLDLAPEGPQLTVSSQQHNLNVQYPPSQIVELEDSEVDVGATIILKCSSVGSPQLEYSWSYYKAANVDQRNEDGVSLLRIHNASAHNMGFYTCRAWNPMGNNSKTVKITVRGVEQDCPIQITPDRMMLEYQSETVNATCQPTSLSDRNLIDLHWEVQGRNRTSGRIWSPDTQKDWDPRPVCVATFEGIGRCEKKLDFTLYKFPDNVTVKTVKLSDVADGGKEIQLRCDMTNVAPAQSLEVTWYQGNEIFKKVYKDQLRLTGCLNAVDDSACSIGDTRSPLNVSSTITVKLNGTDKAGSFSCRFNNMSEPTVKYKPVINSTNLPDEMPVFSGYTEELVCVAVGHPTPTISWSSNLGKELRMDGKKLIISEAGTYNCTATNELGSASHVVKVILKEDYLPLIAGFVAVTVIIISIVFVFIYSIYYKNTRMRRYNLKNPKLSAQNGNVAHNGWEMQFPMTKLS